MARKARAGSGQFRYKLGVPDFNRLADRFGDLADELLDYSEAFAEMPEIFTDVIIDNVASMGADVGARWMFGPRSEDYKRRKQKGYYRRRGPNRADLALSGDLLRMVSSTAGARVGARGVVWTKQSHYLTAVNFGYIGTNKGKRKGGQRPRKFWGLPSSAQRHIMDILDRHTAKKVARANSAMATLEATK